MQVIVVRAHNSADFDEPSFITVGISEEVAIEAMNQILKNRWKVYLNQDDKDFYGTEDNYLEAWRSEIDWCTVSGYSDENRS